MPVAEQCPVVSNQRVLIASSREVFRRQCMESCIHLGQVGEAGGGADALAKLESEQWDEVLLDTQLHDLAVGEVVRMIRSRHPHISVRVLDLDEVADAAEAATAGEADDLESAFPDTFIAQDRAAVVPRDIEPLPGMIGAGRGLARVFHLARLVGRRHTTVLITGETGTGKELVARGIHEVGPRAQCPFVVVNCAAIPESLLEAELFGHTRGAFTGAVQSRLGRIHAAHGGTLFLDEAGELPLSMQAKLLRFLQDGEVQRLGSSDVFRVDVRIISATNQNLVDRVREKQFRQDLYYRLAVFPIELPPLRDRQDDIVPLADHFLKMLSAESDVPCRTLSASAADALRRYPWPGNVRELQHAVERAFILAEGQRQLRDIHFTFAEADIT